MVGLAAIAQQIDPLAAQPTARTGRKRRRRSGAGRARPAAPQLTATDVNAWLDGFMPYALATGDIAGAVVVVVKDGQILTQRGFGYADVAQRTPVDPTRTLFRPGSISKLFTWTAVMQQVEQGRLDLDADVNRYLDFEIPPRDGQPITLRNIMTHTAGFEEQVKTLIGYRPRRHADLRRSMLKRWIPTGSTRRARPRLIPIMRPRSPATSSSGSAGEPFDDYIERHIFAPLGMTQFELPPAAAAAPAADDVDRLSRRLGRAGAVRDRRPGAGRLAQHDRRRHGAVHDRPSQQRRRACSGPRRRR